jgi:hypothetical protein
MTMGCSLVLMNFGYGGSSVGGLVDEFNEAMAMEWINGRRF